MPHTKRAGFTLTEMLYASLVGTILLGSSSSLYILVSKRTNEDASLNLAIAQSTQLADEMQEVIENALSCSVGSSGTRSYLNCTLPTNGTDQDNDGVMDRFPPVSITPDGLPQFSAGQIVAFYWSDNSGEIAPGGTFKDGPDLWRSFSASTGGSTGADRFWSRIGDSTRWTLIDDVNFVTDFGNRSTTITIKSRVLNRSPRRATAADAPDQKAEYTLTRIIPWRNAN